MKIKTYEIRFAEWKMIHPFLDTEDIIKGMFIQQEVSRIVYAQLESADRIVVSQERLNQGIDKVAYNIERVNEGIDSLRSAFEWGLGAIIWKLEQQTEILQKILEVLQAPLETEALELRRRAENAYNNGWIDEAIQDFLESEKKNIYDFTIHMSLGLIFFQHKNNPKAALEYFEKAVKYAKPKSSIYASYALLYIALIKYLQEKYNEAYNAALEAIRISPTYYEAYFQCARYCANLGNHNEAITHLSRAIDGDRYYCIKADAEKDFDPMKEQLHSFFKRLQNKAKSDALHEINNAEKLVKAAKSYSADYNKLKSKYNKSLDTSDGEKNLEVSINKLNDSKTFVKNASLFDCQDAESIAITAQKTAAQVSYKYINYQMDIINEEAENIRKPVDSHPTFTRFFGNFIGIGTVFVLGPLFAVLIGWLVYIISNNIIDAIIFGFVGYLAFLFCIVLIFQLIFKIIRNSRQNKWKRLLKNELETLQKSLIDIKNKMKELEITSEKSTLEG
jgi:tetratricopeptide (TPR) repeat protein